MRHSYPPRSLTKPDSLRSSRKSESIRFNTNMPTPGYLNWSRKAKALKLLLDLKRLTNPKRSMNKETVLGVVRHILTFGGGFVAAKFGVDESVIAEVVGAVMTIVGVAWSVKSKQA
jgi:hypothetical protein